MTTYYVAGNGSSANDGLTRATAKRTFRELPSLNAGDIVNVGAGTYTPRWQWDEVLLISGRNGTASAPIKIQAIAGESQPVLRSNGLVGNIVRVTNSSYVEIHGLAVKGYAESVDFNYAYTNRANRNTDPKLIDNGIVIDTSHHVTIKNCLIEDCSGGGLGATTADYITFDGCQVYRCSHWSAWGNQGIGLLQLTNFDSGTGVRCRIQNCISEGNRNYLQWHVIETADAGKPLNERQGITEGHGIMLDLLDANGYVGKVEVKNNICRNNGGAGIQVFKSRNAVISGNTLENNNQTEELEANGSIFLNQVTAVTLSGNTIKPKCGVKNLGFVASTNISLN